MPHCLDFCCFVVDFEVGKSKSSNFTLFQDISGYSRSSYFHFFFVLWFFSITSSFLVFYFINSYIYFYMYLCIISQLLLFLGLPYLFYNWKMDTSLTVFQAFFFSNMQLRLWMTQVLLWLHPICLTLYCCHCLLILSTDSLPLRVLLWCMISLEMSFCVFWGVIFSLANFKL